jgi:hypothetical protein
VEKIGLKEHYKENKMGRYWNTVTGRDGKFGFGCQSSTDPEDYFKMTPVSVTYGGADEKVVKQKVDEIYDKANVPKDERVYDLHCEADEYEEFYKRYHKYFFEQREGGGFAGNNGVTEGEVFPEAHLCSARLWLGLSILSDIAEDGYCEIDAEM